MGYFLKGSRYNDNTIKLYPTVGRNFIIHCPPHTTGYGTKIKWGIVPQNTNSPQYWKIASPAKRGIPMSNGQFAYSYVTMDDIKQSRDFGGIRCILVNYGLISASAQIVLWQPYKGIM